MKRYLILTAAVLGLFFLHCSRSTIIRKYYTLEEKARPAKQQTAPTNQLAVKIDIRDFVVAKAFDQTRIALRTNTNEINYYYYHLWAVRPATAFGDLVYKLISEENLFQRCIRGFSVGPEYYVSGQVLALERVAVGKKEYAHVSAYMTLYDVLTELPAVEHRFDQRVEMVRDKSMNGFADAISLIIIAETGLFQQRMAEFLNTGKP